MLCFAYWCGTERFVLLTGPVQNALFCLMDRYRNVSVWFMARNCQFQKVGTHGCQHGNHRLPLQGTAWNHGLPLQATAGWAFGTDSSQPGNHGLPLQAPAASQRLELMFSKLRGHHCKELRAPKAWNSWFQTWESIRYQWMDLLIPKN